MLNRGDLKVKQLPGQAIALAIAQKRITFCLTFYNNKSNKLQIRLPFTRKK